MKTKKWVCFVLSLSMLCMMSYHPYAYAYDSENGWNDIVMETAYMQAYEDFLALEGIDISNETEVEEITGKLDDGSTIYALRVVSEEDDLTADTIIVATTEDDHGETVIVSVRDAAEMLLSDDEASAVSSSSISRAQKTSVTYDVISATAYYDILKTTNVWYYRPYKLKVTSSSSTAFTVEYVTAGVRFTYDLENKGAGAWYIPISESSPTANKTYSGTYPSEYYYNVSGGAPMLEHMISITTGSNYTEMCLPTSYIVT